MAAAAATRPAVATPSAQAPWMAQAFQGAGQALPASSRQRLEQRLGHDFSQVRIHTGPAVQRAGWLTGAQAFVRGEHLAWPHQQDACGSSAAQRLLAHELTHVVQQRGRGQARRSASSLEAQADAVAGSAGPVSLTPGGQGLFTACSMDEWLRGSPDLRQRGDTELRDDLDAIEQWILRQTTSSPDMQVLKLAAETLQGELAQRGRLTRQAARGNQKHAKGKGKAAAADPAPGPMPMPRVLVEHASRPYENGAELRDEIDRITAWLRRPDLSRSDRRLLERTLVNLSPAYAQERSQRAQQRHAAVLNQALSVGAGDAREMIVGPARQIDAIRPLPGEPGVSYIMKGSEIVRLGDEQVRAMRQQVMADMDRAVVRIHGITEGVQADWQDMYENNYGAHPGVGFVVSAFSHEDAMDVREKFLPDVQSSNVQLQVYRRLRKEGGAIAPMAEAMVDAAEAADRARQGFDASEAKMYSTAGKLVTALGIVREVGMLAGMVLVATLAAPLAAGFVGSSGLGLTGLAAGGTTVLGTTAITGVAGATLRGAPALAGGLLAGQSSGDAFRYAGGEAWTGLKQGGFIGLGAGTSFAVGRSLGLGVNSMSRGQEFVRTAAAQGAGGFVASTGSALADGKGAGEALKAGALSLPGSLLGAALTPISSGLRSPAWQQAVQGGGNALIGAGGTALAGGSRDDILLGAAFGLTGSLASGSLGPQGEAAYRLGASSGARLKSSGLANARALVVGLDLGLSEVSRPGMSMRSNLSNSQQQSVPGAPGAPVRTQQEEPAGFEVFAELGQELGMTSQTVAAQPGLAGAVADAQAGGLIGAQGASGTVAAAIQPHADASIVRGAYGVTGRQQQSMHVNATSFLRDQPGYNREQAPTLLGDPATHRGFDVQWQRWARAQVANGRRTCSVDEMRGVMHRAIDNIPNMTPELKGFLSWQLELEIHALGLAGSDQVRIPYSK